MPCNSPVFFPTLEMVKVMDRVLNMESKRILVTGVRGLGSSLSSTGRSRPRCNMFDNRHRGSLNAHATLLGRPNFEFVRHDVTFPIYLEVDQIYNLVRPASPIHYQSTRQQPTKTSGSRRD